MATKPTFVVMGATGAQGGAVVNSLLQDGRFNLRATTRNPDSAASQKLRARGVEVVKGDSSDKASLVAAFKNSYGVFGLTNFWDPTVAHHETEHGKNIVDAAKEAGVELFIYSSLPDTLKPSGGKLDVPHFTLKAAVEEHARASGFPIAVFVQAAFYMQNFNMDMMRPKKNADGSVTFAMPVMPDTKHYMVDVDDMGPAVAAIVRDPKKWNGRTIPIYGNASTLEQIAKTFTEVTGIQAHAFHVPLEAVQHEESRLMYQWFVEYGLFGPNADFEATKQLLKTTTWAEWLKKSGYKG